MRVSNRKGISSLTLTALLSLLALPALAGAERLTLPLEFAVEDLQFQEWRGYDLVTLPADGLLSDAGLPALPTRQVRVALPEGEAFVSVRIVDVNLVELPGRFSILPAQPPIPTSGMAEPAWVAPDAGVYGSNAPYPESPVWFVRQTDLAGQGIAVIEVVPLQYRPLEGALSLQTQLVLEIETESGYVCGDYLPANTTSWEREQIEQELRATVVNPEAVSARAARGGDLRVTLPAGDYDYVIIASADLAPSLQTLAAWKTKKGLPATVVMTTWIYGQYSGSNDAKIRAFVADANQQWGATYFLLGGDVDKVPCNEWATSIEPGSVTNDTYYADFDGDWTIEVHVGRATGRYGNYMETFTSKSMTYEKNPPLTGYALQAGLFGFDLDENSPAEECKDYIESMYWPDGWDITHVYDSQTTDHKQAVVDLIESGVNLVNHMDHCDASSIGVGGNNHDAWLTTVEINAFTNTDDETIWYSTGCYAGAYDLNCIAEAFVKNSGGGLVAYVGNAELGWYNPGTCTTLSNLYDILFFQSLFVYGKTALGTCFSEHKNRHFPTSETERYIFRELTLLGDPDLPIWTANPQALTVTHPATYPEDGTALTVHVAGPGGGAVAGARVCLMKDIELYLIALTNASGNATFDTSPASMGMLAVTVTARNFMPSETELELTSGSSAVDEVPGTTLVFALHPCRPSPARGLMTLAFELPRPVRASLAVYDPAGRRVRTLVADELLGAGAQRVIWDGRDEAGQAVASGVYLYRLEAGGEHAMRSVILVR